MRNLSKLINKVRSIRGRAIYLEEQLKGTTKAAEREFPPTEREIMSDALSLVRASTELLQNIGTTWRKDLIARSEKPKKK